MCNQQEIFFAERHSDRQKHRHRTSNSSLDWMKGSHKVSLPALMTLTLVCGSISSSWRQEPKFCYVGMKHWTIDL